jgi:hypothetical protein
LKTEASRNEKRWPVAAWEIVAVGAADRPLRHGPIAGDEPAADVEGIVGLGREDSVEVDPDLVRALGGPTNGRLLPHSVLGERAGDPIDVTGLVVDGQRVRRQG